MQILMKFEKDVYRDSPKIRSCQPRREGRGTQCLVIERTVETLNSTLQRFNASLQLSNGKHRTSCRGNILSAFSASSLRRLIGFCNGQEDRELGPST
jgi:hypothetical protein